MVVDCKPGDIQALTDFMLEDYKNFLKVPELGEETARYIRQEQYHKNNKLDTSKI